jgi:outer membrane protein insertion porin family
MEGRVPMKHFKRFHLASWVLLVCSSVALPAQPARPASGQRVETVNFRGARRVPQETLQAVIATKPGGVYSEDAVRRDLVALWGTQRFDDIRLEVVPGPTGVIVTFVVTERRAARAERPQGQAPPTVAEILDRFEGQQAGTH